MATLTFQVTSVATGTLTKTYTFSEADCVKWLASLGAPQASQAAGALLGWANGVVAKAIADEQAYEKATQINAPLTMT